MDKINRRQFICCSAALLTTPLSAQAFWPFSGKDATASGATDIRGVIFKGDAPETLWKWSKEALWTKKEGSLIHCQLCPHDCILAENDRGFCRTRVVKGGQLYTVAYGNPCSVNLDPVEKKPLFHFLPGRGDRGLVRPGIDLEQHVARPDLFGLHHLRLVRRIEGVCDGTAVLAHSEIRVGHDQAGARESGHADQGDEDDDQSKTALAGFEVVHIESISS